MRPQASTAPAGGGDRPHPSLLGRLLLTTDGTVTSMLEHIVGERIVTLGLAHDAVPDGLDLTPVLPRAAGGTLLYRTTQLVGAGSGRVFVDASSVVLADTLPAGLRADLIATTEPIGRVLRRHRTESFREILSWEAPDGDRAPSRRYLIHIGGEPAMLIRESFRPACFRNHPTPPLQEQS